MLRSTVFLVQYPCSARNHEGHVHVAGNVHHIGVRASFSRHNQNCSNFYGTNSSHGAITQYIHDVVQLFVSFGQTLCQRFSDRHSCKHDLCMTEGHLVSLNSVDDFANNISIVQAKDCRFQDIGKLIFKAKFKLNLFTNQRQISRRALFLPLTKFRVGKSIL